jgi:hypothetical protein
MPVHLTVQNPLYFGRGKNKVAANAVRGRRRDADATETPTGAKSLWVGQRSEEVS